MSRFNIGLVIATGISIGTLHFVCGASDLFTAGWRPFFFTARENSNLKLKFR
ncbi:hypothetical protein [Rickettsiella massiliensis]|uniref:hypothetical protein n=1 Tax=Rickettsiella massiliensis TaxID=676517 RepID=UPI00029A3B90